MSSLGQAVDRDPRAALLALYDTALPQVYGYLLARCGRRALAEDLTAETFLAAVDAVREATERGTSEGAEGTDGAVRAPGATPVSVAWLVGVARHKLVDHWRRQAREERALTALAGEGSEVDDPWDARLDSLRAQDVLADLGPHHRAVLTLRYCDDLPVREVAALLDRTEHATEALLVRARGAFRRAYEAKEGGQ